MLKYEEIKIKVKSRPAGVSKNPTCDVYVTRDSIYGTVEVVGRFTVKGNKAHVTEQIKSMMVSDL